ncbi:alpha-L-arabinofuranosidase [Opitutus terrae]|uniref:Alpha-L-arabinofuranosidase-like protein n=1 Tax=Opitutus terrae (strain DSM 11246 / JCM 15787 / PB90-1) TaxID=452637 RepID=B1ZZJ5_OPITP|nr:alpha-L-arabinofuranosidase [Opitutus terrae]ACB76398.1 Alpha-L-arabinofuranosidase-like protein [Opitutus terrae PB90-1]
MRHPRLPLLTLALLTLTFLFRASAHAQSDIPVYDDALGSGWQNWSWATVNLSSTTLVHGGSTAIAVDASPWSALSLRHDPLDTTGYGKLTFWINGGPTGGQTLRVSATLNDAGQPAVVIGPLAVNTWQLIEIPLVSLGADDRTDFTGFWIQEGTGNTAPTFYVDDIVLKGSVPTVPPPPLVGMALYEDAFVNGWQNWSWANVNAAATNPVNSGASSIAVTSDPFTAVYFHHTAMPTDSYDSLTFWIHGGSEGGQVIKVSALLSDTAQPGITLPPLTANTWQKITLSLADLGVAERPDLTGIWFQENAGVAQPTYYLDDVRLNLAPPPAVVHATVDARHILQKVDPRLFGLNTAIWDGAFDTATTAELLVEADNQALRFPGGSISDIYHWETNTNDGETWQWATSFDEFAHIATLTKAQVYITVNYGTGTPEEAAAWVRYANRTKDYDFKYWEVGNENYGTWEADRNDRPHDPVTYAHRFKDYYRQMKTVDRTIKVGAVITATEDTEVNYPDLSVTNPRTGAAHSGWTPVLLATLKQLGVIPDFVVYHRYEQAPGGENDAFLLTSARTWPDDAARIRQILNDYLGRDARRVEINCTENNSVYSNPGKQTTSLVNGLFLADSFGNIMKTEFRAFFWWDLRNGQEAGNNNSASLYGWRRYGDYGVVTAADPAGPADRYPTYYVYKLLQHFARGGESVVEATSDYNGLGLYAVREHNRALRLLIINKHPTETLNASIAIDGFKVDPQAKAYSYGIPQDEAARTGTGSADVAETNLTLAGNTFTFSPAPYSVTVIQLDKGNRGHHGDHDHDHDDDDDGDDGGD